MPLSEQQQQAVETTAPMALVAAGAGTGKTRVLTERVHWLLEHGETPSSLIVGTYTRKAAGELRHRLLSGGFGDHDLTDLWVGTLHALVWRMVTMFRQELGFPSLPTLFGQVDQQALADWIAEELRLPRPPSGFEMARRMRLAERGSLEKPVKDFLRQYEADLVSWNAIDYDGLIDLGGKLARLPACRDWITNRFSTVLLDEGQDIACAQWGVLQELFPTQHWFVVASTPQQIQSFSGVRRADLRAFAKQADVLVLDESFRCPEPILALANSQLHGDDPLEPKCHSVVTGGWPPTGQWFPDAAAEMEWVSSCIQELLAVGESPSNIAILARTNALVQAMGEVLFTKQIHAQVVGRHDVFERKTAQLVISLLRVVMNKRDEWSFWRGAKLIGTPKGDRPRVLGLALRTGQPWWNAVSVWGQTSGHGSPLNRLVKVIIEIGKWLPDVGSAVQAVDGVLELLHTVFPRVDLPIAERVLLRREVQKLADALGGLTVEGFLGWLGTRAAVDLHDAQQEAVTVLTCHSAKGLEWPLVFVIGLEDGLFPHVRSLNSPEDLAEEARVFYVAATRAKDQLRLTGAARRLEFGRTRERQPSPFLAPLLGEEVLHALAD